MKVLVIGGTYFLGCVFTISSYQDYELTLVNRGHYSMQDYHVEEYHFDRHQKDQWQNLDEHYDVIVDFCAYQKGDIQTVVDAISFDHYIYISTVDVYERGTGQIKRENHPLEYRYFGGEIGHYIAAKVVLEYELQEACSKHQKLYTSIRPGQIYGPFNYAPRESELIKRMIDGLPLINPIDADAYFQLVYVQDVVNAIQLIIEHKPTQHAFNIIHPQRLTYNVINESLSQCSKTPVTIINQTIQETDDYPFVFPLTKAEEELYDGHLIETPGLTYTSIQDGLSKTYNAFYPVFHQEKNS